MTRSRVFGHSSCYPPADGFWRPGARPRPRPATSPSPSILTQGAGPLRPGDELQGQATFTAIGESFRQEGGSTAHLASGEMQIGDGISGHIWTLIITSEGPSSDLVGVYANHVEGSASRGSTSPGPWR
jgi:hypothetical protein